jgi:hypothetical protein
MELSIPPANLAATDMPVGDRCRLLELPAELRLHIYSLVFSEFGGPDGRPSLLTCRLVREDGTFLAMMKPNWRGMNIMPLL